MKNSRFAGLAGTVAITALAFAGTAHAANLPMPAPAAPAWQPMWAGYYIGVNGGGIEGTTRTGVDIFSSGALPNANLIPVGSNGSFNNSGSIIGGQFGYMFNLKAPSWFPWGYVSALEVSFDAMSLKGSNATAGILPTPPGAANAFTFNNSVGANWLLLLTERAGFDWGNWFPYATAGFAVANLKYSTTYADPVNCTNCPIGGAFSKTALGLAWGAGLEWRWDNHWSLRGEYLYLWFADDVTGTTTPFDVALGGATVFKNHATFGENIGRGALSYRW